MLYVNPLQIIGCVVISSLCIHIINIFCILQVPGFREWFNVVYDGEDFETVKDYKLFDDLKNGQLKVL